MLRIILINFWLLALLAPASGDEADSQPDPRSMWDLAGELDDLRGQLQQLQQEWQDEDMDLQAQIGVYEQILAQEEARIQALQQEKKQAVAELEALTAQQEAQLQAMAELAEVRHIFAQALSHLQENSLLLLAGNGSTGDAAAAHTDAGEAWQESLAKLEQLERHARGIHLRLREGRLPDGSTRVVEVIAVGHAAAWWRALDGSAVGTARVVDGSVELEPIASSGEQRAIQQAFRIRSGGMPQILPMPLSEPIDASQP